MGLSSLAVVMGIIPQIYSIDLLINSKYQQKFALARLSQTIGLTKSRAIGLTDPKARMKMTLLDLRDRFHPKVSDTQFVNRGFDVAGNFVVGGMGPCIPMNPGLPWNAQPPSEMYTAYRNVGVDPIDNFEYWLNTLGAQGSVPVENRNGTPTAPGQVPLDENNQPLKPGEVFVDKATAEAIAEYYLQHIKSLEQEIDMELETLKAQRAALTQQREEFTKYVAEGIKTSFKNNYA